jgi:hypothetical protein
LKIHHGKGAQTGIMHGMLDFSNLPHLNLSDFIDAG